MGCAGPAFGKVGPQCHYRIGVHIFVERATEKIYLTSDEPWPVRGLADLGVAEVPIGGAPWRVGSVRVCSIEGPYVEVLDAVTAVEKVQRRPLAERDGDDPVRQHAEMGLPVE
jgi:hypothetical protein